MPVRFSYYIFAVTNNKPVATDPGGNLIQQPPCGQSGA